VFTSPVKRARRTCELSGFAHVAELDQDLVEWNYGRYEGLHRLDILRERPDWQLFRDGCPGAELPNKSLNGPLAWWRTCAELAGTFSFFPAGILFACWLLAGLES
jgi:broad specificity phosphatase PhoE